MKITIKVAIIGSRSIKDRTAVWDYMHKVVAKYPDVTFVSGGCEDGPDKEAYWFCITFGYDIIVCGAGHAIHGNKGFHMRNERIATISDVVVAFYDGKSKGTLSTIRYAKSLGKKVITPLSDV